MVNDNKLFKGADNWHKNACVNFGWNPDYGYAMGYKEAANYLAKNAADLNKQDFFCISYRA